MPELKSQIEEINWIFPFTGMSVGESFFIPTLKPASLIYTAETLSKLEGVRVKAYPATKDNILGVRVWRVR